MNSFPTEIKFQKTWRSYQARVLSELEEHLGDSHLNVVAAPGSGKTVLGLEVVRRLNKPALILSPTLAIRDQWVDRLVNLFLPEGQKKPKWISTDIRKPAFLTVATYQALHSAYSGKIEDTEESEYNEENENNETDENNYEGDENNEIDDNNYNDENNEADENPDKSGGRNKISCSSKRTDIVSLFKKAGLKTMVVDEAHHLRSEWWKSLIKIKKRTGNPTVVALTATPPYDVSIFEWKRYESLCGPVDAEVGVPELVLEGNLCPHQDYIYFSSPSKDENEIIKKFRTDVDRLFREITRDTEFTKAIEEHPWINEPDNHIEEILSDPSYFSSIAIFLNHRGKELPEKLLDVMGVSGKKLPELNLEWMEILLRGCLYTDSENYLNYDNLMEKIKRNLIRIGALERKKVKFQTNDGIKKLLGKSITKLNSIFEIAKIEIRYLGSELRMVILTDYIRKSEMPKSPDDIKPLNSMGVVPIFEKIRREFKSSINRKIKSGIKLGVLSGSLIIIPKSSANLLESLSVEMGIDKTLIKLSVLKHDCNYVAVEICGDHKKRIVHLITKLFSKGGINVLVGTKSLLGEGWDAPSINSLVLASFVGSYMVSNQMRGRAIRSLQGNPKKTSNIWHLVCVEPGMREKGDDLKLMSRRFKAFLGVSFKEPFIENGINRLDIGKPPFTRENIDLINNRMIEHALDRNSLGERWDDALRRGKKGVRMVEEVKTRKAYLPRDFVFKNTIAALALQGVSWGIYLLSEFLQGADYFRGDSYLNYIGLIFAAFAVFKLPGCLKAIWLFFKHGPVESSMGQIGEALLKTLSYTKIIKTDISLLRINTGKDKNGGVFCSLEGATTYEKSIYLSALKEIMDPVENPKYLLVRKSNILKFSREDYHAVPAIIGRKKEFAKYFAKMWGMYVGETQLIYTRTREVRKLLLKARGSSLSSAFQKRAERRVCWK